MPKGYVRKVCRDCRTRTLGRASTIEWCDRCGGELVTITYGRARKARRGR